MEAEDINRKRAGAEDRRREKMNESRDLGGSIKKEDGELRGGETSRKRARGGEEEETAEVVQKREQGIRDGRSEETEKKEINHKEEPEEETRRKRTARSVDFGGNEDRGSIMGEKVGVEKAQSPKESEHHISKRRREKRPNTDDIKRERMAEATQEEQADEPMEVEETEDQQKKAALLDACLTHRPFQAKQRGILMIEEAQRRAHEDIQRSQLVHTKDRLVQPAFKPNILIFGEQRMDLPFESPFPTENKQYDVIFYCDVCMKYFASERTWTNHKNRCRSHHPPGNEIYRSVEDRISVFEVDAGTAEEYCEGLCLLGKCFIKTKSVYDNFLNLFLFYVLMKRDKTGFKFVGFFSKEKQEPASFAVGSIMLLPSYRGKGYGRFLIDLAYQLTKKLRLGVALSVERPFSDLGSRTINRFWQSAILEYMYSKGQGTKVKIDDIVKATAIADQEVMAVLKSLRFLRGKGKKISPKWKVVEEHYEKAIKNRNRIWLNPDDLRWTPFRERSTEMDGQETPDDEEYGSLEDVEEQGIPGERKASSWAVFPAMGHTLEFPKEILKADREFDDIDVSDEPILHEEPKRFGILPIELSERIDRLNRPKTPPVKSDSDSDDDWPPLPIEPDGRSYIPTKGSYQKNATPSVDPDSMDVDSEVVGHSQLPDEEYEDEEVEAPKEVYNDHLSYKLLELMEQKPPSNEKKDTTSSFEFTISKPAAEKEKTAEAHNSHQDGVEKEKGPTDRSVQLVESSEEQGHPEPVDEDCEEEEIVFLGKVQGEKSKKPAKELKTSDGLSEKPVKLVQKKPSIRRWKVPRHPPSLQLRLALLARTRGKAVTSGQLVDAFEGQGLTEPPVEDHEDEATSVEPKVQGEEVKTPASEIHRDSNSEQQAKLVEKQSPRDENESTSSVSSPIFKAAIKKEQAPEAPNYHQDVVETEGGPTDRSVQLMDSSDGQGHPEPAEEDCEDEEIVFLRKVQGEKAKTPESDQLPEKKLKLVEKKPSRREKESSGFSHVSTTSKAIDKKKKKKAPEPIEPPPLKKQPVTNNILSLFSASTTAEEEALGCISTDGLNLRIPKKEKPIKKKDIPKEKLSEKEDVPEDPQSRAITDSRGFVPSSSNQHPDLLRSSEVDSMERSVADSRSRDVEMYENEQSHRRGDERQPRRGNYDEPRESSASGRWDHGSRERRGYYRIGYDDSEPRDRSNRSYHESRHSRDNSRHSGGYSGYDNHSSRDRTGHNGDHSRSFGHSEIPSIRSYDDSGHSSRDHSGGQRHSNHSNRDSWYHNDDNNSWSYPTGHSDDYSEYHSVGSHPDGSTSWDRGGHSDTYYASSNYESHGRSGHSDHSSYRDRYDAMESRNGDVWPYNYSRSRGYSDDYNQNRYGNNSTLERSGHGGHQYRQDEREAGYGGVEDHLANSSGHSYERDREGHHSHYDERDGRGDYAADFSYSSTADSRSDYYHSYKYRDSRRG